MNRGLLGRHDAVRRVPRERRDEHQPEGAYTKVQKCSSKRSYEDEGVVLLTYVCRIRTSEEKEAESAQNKPVFKYLQILPA